jgi:putative hydroxymethylpyrimidine transport system substrate-binding protein
MNSLLTTIVRTLSIMILACCAASTYAANKQPEKLTVILDWFPNPDHAPLVIAQQQGFFKEQNLDVELIGPADPTDPPKWVAAGKADIGITYQPEFMQQVDQGLPLMRIGSLIDKPLDCIVALKGNGINTIKDLKGKRIGSGTGGTSAIMLKTMLKNNGLTVNDVELINVRYSLTQALLSRKVDAVTGMMRNFEIPQIESKGQNIIAFFPEDNGIPNYSVLIFITNTSKANDPRLPRFLSAIRKAVAWLDDHPREGWKIFAKMYPESNNPVNHAAWFATMPYFAEDPAEFNQDEWQKFAAFMLDNNLIHKQQPTSRYAAVLG